MRQSFLLLIALLIAGVAFAAEPVARLTPPVLGFVFDPASKSVRPIAGIPGAASIEGALPSATKLEIGFVSQNGRRLLAGTLDGAVLVDLSTRHNPSTELQGAPADIALGAWSPGGDSFAIWTRSGKLHVWTGVPESPVLKFSADVDAPTGIAVADGGRLASFWNESGLSLVSEERIWQAVTGRVSTAAFKAGGVEWAAIADSQLLRSNAEPTALEVPKASAIAFGSRGILIGGDQVLAILGDAGLRFLPCVCTATALERLAGTDVFRLTGLDAGSIAIYDGDSIEPRIVYIPTEGDRR